MNTPKHNSSHGGSIPLTRYARKQRENVGENVVRVSGFVPVLADPHPVENSIGVSGEARESANENQNSLTNDSHDGTRKIHFGRPLRARWSSHAGTVGLSVVRRVKWALQPPILWPVFFTFLFVYLAGGAKPLHRPKAPPQQAIYDRAVNMTLDTVMWVHEQHHGKLSWAQLNAEVCKQMKVRRLEPWERK